MHNLCRVWHDLQWRTWWQLLQQVPASNSGPWAIECSVAVVGRPPACKCPVDLSCGSPGLVTGLEHQESKPCIQCRVDTRLIWGLPPALYCSPVEGVAAERAVGNGSGRAECGWDGRDTVPVLVGKACYLLVYTKTASLSLAHKQYM